MTHFLTRFLLLNGTIGRTRYFATGILLILIKYMLDKLIALAFGQPWSPLNYLIWPNHSRMLVHQLPAEDRQFGLVMLIGAVPFIWVGVTLTLQRLRDAQLPLALIVLFFVPIINVLFLLGLSLIPTRPPVGRRWNEPMDISQAQLDRRHNTGQSISVAFVAAAVASALLAVALVYLSANFLQSYGFGVFVAVPFVQGWLAAVLFGLERSRSARQCINVALASLAISGIALLALAIEGAICLLMASPIALFLGILGAMVGYAMQSRPWVNDYTPSLMLGIIILMPALMAAESLSAPRPALREVRTQVVVDAPPERVWSSVIAFPPLSEPTELLFRCGIAYPQRAEIHGRGAGAVRHCIFSTGAFVEPIEVWDEPSRLAFRVTDQPPPMEELSPFDIHPPHLDNFLVSQRGEFRLTRLDGGRTILLGTTWYTNRMWPEFYWNIWSDFIIHRIHSRVLEHVRDLAERERRADLSASEGRDDCGHCRYFGDPQFGFDRTGRGCIRSDRALPLADSLCGTCARRFGRDFSRFAEKCLRAMTRSPTIREVSFQSAV